MRGDSNADGELNEMDAVVCKCVANSMLTDLLTIKLSDKDVNNIIYEKNINSLA